MKNKWGDGLLFAIIVYLIIVFIILAVISIISNLRNNGEIRRKIEEQWGKRSDKKYNKEDSRLRERGSQTPSIKNYKWKQHQFDVVFFRSSSIEWP